MCRMLVKEFPWDEHHGERERIGNGKRKESFTMPVTASANLWGALELSYNCPKLSLNGQSCICPGIGCGPPREGVNLAKWLSVAEASTEWAGSGRVPTDTHPEAGQQVFP